MAKGRNKKHSSGKQPDYLSTKDDGTRWIVVDSNDQPIYLGKEGVIKPQAEHLAKGLVQPATIKQVT